MITVKKYAPPPFCESEALRYARAGELTPEIKECLEVNYERLAPAVDARVCYTVLPVSIRGSHIDFGAFSVESADLAKNLGGCEKAVLFAATVGHGVDRVIRRYGTVSASDGVMLQAIGAERVEKVCDEFNEEIRKSFAEEGCFLRPRFSAGYGDLSIETQSDILRTLDASRKIGITLNSGYIMSPSKSVTAFIGISAESGIVR